MKMQKMPKRFVVGIVFGLTCVPVLAQWAVFDPTNFVQNYSQAISGIKTEVNTAQTLIQQTQAAIHMAKSVKTIADVSGLAQVKESLNLYQQLKTVDGQLENDFQQSSQLTERVRAQYGASNMSWADFLSSSKQLDVQQRDTAAQRYRVINASIDQTSRQRQAIVSQLGNVQGQTEAMQTLGAAIDVLIGQNQQIISILAANNRVADMKQDAEATKTEKSAAEAARVMNSYQQRMRDAANKY
jgi:conjugal transfer/entry exclusion protein